MLGRTPAVPRTLVPALPHRLQLGSLLWLYKSGKRSGAPSCSFGLQCRRPELTWRDIQHLCVRTAVHINPEDPDWQRTAIGRPYSYKYGFGRLDGYAFVTKARDWELVKPQAWLEVPTITLEDAAMEA